MKTIFTLLLSTLFSLSSMAYDGTRLTVTSISKQKIFVEVDGRRYSMNNNTVSIRSIRPGTHTVRVLREVKRKGWNFGIGNNKREEVIYSIRTTMKDGYHFDILVNRFGKVMIDERRIDRDADWYADDEEYYEKDRDRGWDNNRDNGDYDDDDRYERDDRDDNDRYDRDDRNRRYDVMRDASFNQAKETLRNEWFENTRLSTAKQIIDRNYFTSRQVKELVLLFTFENNRLDIAKYAYHRTVDKGNYFIMQDAFSMNKNKEELNNYIREHR